MRGRGLARGRLSLVLKIQGSEQSNRAAERQRAERGGSKEERCPGEWSAAKHGGK